MACCPLSAQPVFLAGYPVDGAVLYAYDAETTTPRALYLSAALDPTRVHPIPVQLVDGQWPMMWAGAGAYDLAIYGPDGGLIRVVEGIPGEVAATSNASAGAGVATGDILLCFRTGNRTGFVRLNGGTIGSAASAGSERANDDCHDLFVFLWGQSQAAMQLTVSGGRGVAGAEADWQANKTITLPNLQNRVPVGLQDMGAPGSAASITGVPSAVVPNGTVLGATGGEAVHTLTPGEIGSQSTGAVAGTSTQAIGGTIAAHNNLQPFTALAYYMKL